jgi:hypothetical protein
VASGGQPGGVDLHRDVDVDEAQPIKNLGVSVRSEDVSHDDVRRRAGWPEGGGVGILGGQSNGDLVLRLVGVVGDLNGELSPGAQTCRPEGEDDGVRRGPVQRSIGENQVDSGGVTPASEITFDEANLRSRERSGALEHRGRVIDPHDGGLRNTTGDELSHLTRPAPQVHGSLDTVRIDDIEKVVKRLESLIPKETVLLGVPAVAHCRPP